MSKKLLLFVSLLCAACLLQAQTVPLANAAQGDIVTINGVRAMVFKTYGDGHGKAVALTAFRGVENAWGRASRVKTLDRQSGRANTEAVYRFAQEKGYDIRDSPVFAWCKSLGNGWYIPSVAELEAFVNYWMGNATELDWDSDDSDVAQPQPTKSSGRGTTSGQNEHTKKVNKKIADEGGVPFGTGVFSSTEEGGKILVFEYKIYREGMPWRMEKVGKGSLGAKYAARAFFDY
jgi:hypothetical protein